MNTRISQTLFGCFYEIGFDYMRMGKSTTLSKLGLEIKLYESFLCIEKTNGSNFWLTYNLVNRKFTGYNS